MQQSEITQYLDRICTASSLAGDYIFIVSTLETFLKISKKSLICTTHIVIYISE